jgi:hypothetical protein
MIGIPTETDDDLVAIRDLTVAMRDRMMVHAKPRGTVGRQQPRYGIWIGLVRESLLENDTDLLCDIGIYGSRAVGMQTADPAGRTIRFVLDFNFPKIQEAEARWNRLAVYAVPFRELLEQQH